MKSAMSITCEEFKRQASLLKDSDKMAINELADIFCEASDKGDEFRANISFSALMTRFFPRIPNMLTKMRSLNWRYENCFDAIVDSVLAACKKDARVWQKPDSKINAQQAINQIIETRHIRAAFYDSNLKKNEGKHNMKSLDQPISQATAADSNVVRTLADTIADKTVSAAEYSEYRDIIQYYLNKNKIVEAIILDNILFNDSIKQEKVTEVVDGETKVHYEASLWEFLVVKNLKELDAKYENYFRTTYKIAKEPLNAALQDIARANSTKKYKMLDKTRTDLRLLYQTVLSK